MIINCNMHCAILSFEYEKLIVQNEKKKEREAKIERWCQQEKAKLKKRLGTLPADKKAAVGDTKLKAIEEVILEEKLRELEKVSLSNIPEQKE